MNVALQRFADAVNRPDPALELDVAALLLGAIAGEGEIDIPAARRALDGLAERAAALRDAAAEESAEPRWAGARAIQRALAEEGFRGNAEDYYDPHNSFLHRVLQRRLGIPISLAVVYLEIARRIGVEASGVGFPGHFLVRVESGGQTLFTDPFRIGAELDSAALERLLHRTRGGDAKVEPAMLLPVAKRSLLQRMLFNLAGIYGQQHDRNRSLAVLERLALLDPSDAQLAHRLLELRSRMRALN